MQMNKPVRFGILLVASAVLSLCLLLSGCGLFKAAAPPGAESALKRVRFTGFLEFTDDCSYDGLASGLSQSLAYLRRVPPEREYRFGPDTYTAGHMVRTLTRFLEFIRTKPAPPALNRFIHEHYRIYRARGAPETGKVLFTGYYEPTLRGSLTPSEEFRYPLYSRPEDLLTIDLSRFSPRFANEKIVGRKDGQTVVPYYDRRQIEQDCALADVAAPIAWVDDPIDLFFLHIQGSGKILLENGDALQVHYHASNGRPYRSIGKLLIQQGKIEKKRMSMQALRAYLEENPSELDAVLNYNPSYVFFKVEPDGPLGSLAVKLTAGRSLALDRRLFPPAALAFIKTQLPLVGEDGQIQRWANCSRFVLNQDTGGAIRGPGRADLFWGDGPYAETAAGHMQHPGDLYFLVLKPNE